MFSLRLPLIIVCENTRRIERSYAHENYRKTFCSTVQAVYCRFHGAGKQWTSNMFSWPSLFAILCENTWKMQHSRAWENYRKTVRKTSCTLAFSWSRKTINKHHVFIAFTVDNSVGKRLENAAFARSGKLWKNVQENKLYTSVFVEQENNRKTSCFHGIHR